MYGEACTALPLNGGAYNVLLNTTSKIVASLAACLTILSYTATAVVSASESVYVPRLDSLRAVDALPAAATRSPLLQLLHHRLHWRHQHHAVFRGSASRCARVLSLCISV
jgi:amino acid transporter